MTIESPDEKAMHAMWPIWMQLDAVRARDEALGRFILEELPPGTKADEAGMTAGLQLALEFQEIWPNAVPECWELVQADRAGRLTEKIEELNAEFAAA